MRRVPDEQGFSLVEMLVALSILLIGLAVTVEIAHRAHKLLAASGRELQAPPIGAIFALLRSDIEAAKGFESVLVGDGIWMDRRLVLVHEDGAVLYELESHELSRTVIGNGGRVLSTRVLARTDRGLERFRWRALGPELIEVAIDSQREPGVRPNPRGVPRARHDVLRCALRGEPRRWGW
jgi:prepilin-type N-terminal cleavage/methylation domain-containing protein